MAGTHIVERREVKVVRAPVVVEVVPLAKRPAYQAFMLLRVGYAILPIVAGLDKFLNILSSWEMYLATPVEKILPVTDLKGANVLVLVGPDYGSHHGGPTTVGATTSTTRRL